MIPRRHLHRWLAIAAAVAVAVVVAVTLIHWLANDVRQNQRLKAESLMAVVDEMAEDSATVLTQLNQLTFTTCSDDHLLAMRRAQFLAKHVKDIGFFEGNQLLCTTGVGVLASPYSASPPDYVTAKGYQIWVNRSLFIANQHHSAMLVRHGRYNVVVEPRQLDTRGLAPFDWQLVFRQNDKLHPILGTPGMFRDQPVTERRWLDLYQEYCSAQTPYCLALDIKHTSLADGRRMLLLLIAIISVLAGAVTLELVKRQLIRYHSLEARIRRGLEQGAFYCLYQPIIALESQRVVGCEVLARFNDSDGPLYPDQFIPIMRTSGRTWAFTRQISERALAELDAETALPEGFRVSINIFPQDVASDAIAAFPTLPAASTSRFQLVLEVTEDERLDSHQAHHSLAALRHAGIGIAIDDFGTGYANLKQLRNLHCQWLKIDRSYVMEMEEGSIKSTLIPHIAEIARQLGLAVVAEGIENLMQHQALLEVGIEFGQGWAFGKPMSAAALAERVTASNRDPD